MKTSNSTISLFHYSAIPLFCYSAILFFRYSTIPLFHYFTISLFHYSTIPQFHNSTILLFHYSSIPLFHYSTIPLFDYSTLPLFHSSTIPLFHSSTIPLFHYSTLSLFPLALYERYPTRAARGIEKIQGHSSCQPDSEILHAHHISISPVPCQLIKMSDEGVETPVSANEEKETGEENANNGSGNGESTKEPKKFSVLKVKFGPELNDPPADTPTDDPNEPSSPSVEVGQPRSPLTPENFTFGYATNEAIPMTIFYRSQHSQGHGGKQRPTLQELRKGLENDKVRNYSSSSVPMDHFIKQRTVCVLFILVHSQTHNRRWICIS